MGGGLIQLIIKGSENIYLTGNPQMTFFKAIYRRHTNFAMESIEQTIKGNIGLGNTVNSDISRNGDLIHKMYLQLDITPGSTNNRTGPNSVSLSDLMP